MGSLPLYMGKDLLGNDPETVLLPIRVFQDKSSMVASAVSGSFPFFTHLK
jgi:hypothetical protein